MLKKVAHKIDVSLATVKWIIKKIDFIREIACKAEFKTICNGTSHIDLSK